MSDRTSRESVRERDERDARFFAWDVPGHAHIVALVHEADDAERSATVADAIATSVARRREHTLLLCAAPGPSPLDELLGGAASPGLPAALEGRARLTDVAVQRVDRPFVYLPAGRDPVAMRALLGDDLLTSFIARVRERGGTLFIVLSEETLLADGLVSLLDGYVALGDAELPAELEALAQFGRVRFEDSDPPAPSAATRAPAATIALPELPDDLPRGDDGEAAPLADADRARGADEAESAESREATGAPGGADAPGENDASGEVGATGRPSATPWTRPDEAPPGPAGEPPAEPEAAADETPDRAVVSLWRRHRKRPEFPLVRVALGAAFIGAVAVAWWMIARAADPAERAGPTEAEAAQAEASTGAPPVVFDAAEAARAFERAPALGYSVLIASYADRADAEERLAGLRSRSDGFYFLAPTPVRGVVYHRVFAGALAGRDRGEALMAELVGAGLKDEASEWDVRPAALAFDLGLFARREQAETRVRTLAGRSIPAYAVTAGDGTDGPWRVYGGAYESERASGPLAEMLDDAGEPAALVERRGAVSTPSSRE